MYWGRIGNLGQKVELAGFRHISTSGFGARALRTVVFCYFGQYGRRMASDGQTIGLGGQGRLQNTTSGPVKPEVVVFGRWVRIYRKVRSKICP